MRLVIPKSQRKGGGRGAGVEGGGLVYGREEIYKA